MKKKLLNKRALSIIALLMIIILLIPTLGGCDNNSSRRKITLNEVAHSIFYAPQYVALELGYFKDEGLDVKLETGFGADKTMTAVLSGEADIGFMGSESSIYVYNQGAEDYVVNFAQLTQRAGNFLVSRDVNEEFNWENIKGKTILGGRAGGMPEMILEYILIKEGIDPKKDVNIIQNIDFGHTAEAFASGNGDYTVEFEPGATSLENGGNGKIVQSLGLASGMVPYTAYSAKKSYIEKNPEIIQKFTNAIQKGLEYVNHHTPEEIAKVIKPQFPETDKETLVTIIKRYYDQETWKENAVFKQESFNLLQNILEQSGELTKRVPYENLINTEFATKAYEK